MAKHYEDPENPDKIPFEDLKTRIVSGRYPIREIYENTPSSDKDCDSK